MSTRIWLATAFFATMCTFANTATKLPACCAVFPPGKPVVNADQTVVMVWNEATKIQHFIRKASFKSTADDFGFLVPTPSQPELEEAGSDAFPFLATLTAPEIRRVKRPAAGGGCGCLPQAKFDGVASKVNEGRVDLLQQKLVAGFNAVVLQANSATALVGWLKDNGYTYSPEIETWAKPYVQQGWKFTALKVAKKANDQDQAVAAAALRITFKTERPLFPYREPDYKASASLTTKSRLLRIFFISNARYDGELTKESPWTGKVAWAGKLSPDSRKRALDLLKLPETACPADSWMTEFEDNWPYTVAPADVYFSRAADQSEVRRPPIIEYVSTPAPVDATWFAFAVAMLLPTLIGLFRRGNRTMP